MFTGIDDSRDLSFIANRGIAVKVALGFVCVLAILAVASGSAYLSFQNSEDGFANYVQASLRPLLQQGLATIKNSERHRPVLNGPASG